MGDCALIADTENDLQAMNDKFSEACKFFNLQISFSKIKVLYQTSPASEAFRPHLKIDGTYLKKSLFQVPVKHYLLWLENW